MLHLLLIHVLFLHLMFSPLLKVPRFLCSTPQVALGGAAPAEGLAAFESQGTGESSIQGHRTALESGDEEFALVSEAGNASTSVTGEDVKPTSPLPLINSDAAADQEGTSGPASLWSLSSLFGFAKSSPTEKEAQLQSKAQEVDTERAWQVEEARRLQAAMAMQLELQAMQLEQERMKTREEQAKRMQAEQARRIQEEQFRKAAREEHARNVQADQERAMQMTLQENRRLLKAHGRNEKKQGAKEREVLPVHGRHQKASQLQKPLEYQVASRWHFPTHWWTAWFLGWFAGWLLTL
eukprot:gnl/MRDRNA2_/MRDRNA2_111461_c0_seq1.p1 gnl/MRDRNA2_/MRDRNA2_111461_c0~~gnl/MRDRNA2_/MRDRNA2_111461_c0_seq1.p1  ORF type:complete len:295 (-),score=75.73 gnl/MRDRNA2_/MRDRNA2_111461_c0_seq1:96-980(-)